MTLRVLQLGPVPPPEGGVSRNMLAIRDALSRREDVCSIIATTKGQGGEDEIYRPSSSRGLIQLLRRLRYDILHLHVGGTISWRVLGLCLACTTFGRGRSVLSVHSGGFVLSAMAKAANRRAFAGRVFRRFDRVIAVSDAIADVMARFGVKRERLGVISPFVLSLGNTNRALPEPVERFSKSHSPLLISVGGLEKDYDPDFLIEAMPVLVREHPTAGLIIVGDGSMRGEIERKLRAHQLRDRILLTGDLDHSSTIKLMERADVVLRTTRFDGDAVSVREALALGVPVVATDTGNRPAGIQLIQFGDQEGLLSAIGVALREGRLPASDNDGSQNIEAVLRIYAELAAR